MKIYRVLGAVYKNRMLIFKVDRVIINNLETAINCFNNFVERSKEYQREKGCTADCEVFEPVIYYDGELMYYAEDLTYIKKFWF